MADPLLGSDFAVMSLNQAVGIASMCLQEEPSVRPLFNDIVAALSFLATAPKEAPVPPSLLPMLSSNDNHDQDESESDDEAETDQRSRF